ncbi:MAG TPA: protease pro-enzyme activation domain-containing protein [Acidobacteriaceae bacterium]
MVRKSSVSAQVLAACAVVGTGLLSLGIAATAHAQATPRITGQVETSALVSLPGEVHPWASAQFDRGIAPANLSGHMLMVLKRSPEQESALQTFLASQQDTTSPNYHKWLTPEDFGKRFGVADSDVQTVTSYLSSQGISVGRVYSNHMAIELGATAGQIRSTFQTEIHAYAVGGKTYYANNSNPKIPAALSSVVSGFASLNNFHVAGGSGAGTQATLDATTHTLKPLYTTTSGGKPLYGISPADLAVIYGVPVSTGIGLGGTNVNVGIVGDSDININYVNNYRTTFGLGTNPPVVVVDGNDPGVNDDAYIAYKQIELVSAVAPNANIYYYTSATTDYDNGIYFALIRAVEDNQVQVLLNGFQECEHAIGVGAMELVSDAAEEAAAQGMTFVAASGNSGSAGCAIPGTAGSAVNATYAVNGFASSPYLTAVGGTDFYYTTSTAAASYWDKSLAHYQSIDSAYLNAHPLTEQVWNDSYSGNGNSNIMTAAPSVQMASGGGPSTDGQDGTPACLATATTQNPNPTCPQPMPPYQIANANAKTIGNGVARVIPDVSFFAGSGASNTEGYNETAYMFCMKSSDCLSTGTVQFSYSGGTEASSAVFAGAVALAVEKYNSASRFGLGNVNPTLYSQLAATPPTIVRNDVTLGTNELACSSGPNCSGTHMSGYAAGTGYDAATGLGSFNITSFVTNYKPTNTAASSVALTVTDSTGKPLTSCVSGGVTQPHCVVHSTWLQLAVTATPSAATGDVAIFTSSPLQAESSVETLTLVKGTGTASDPSWNLLPGGSYNLYARYAGDSTYGPSLSTAYPITVLPENCQMKVYGHNINIGATTNVPYGTPVNITVEPYSSLSTNNDGIPSGSINVTDSPTLAGTGSLITTLPINSEGAATFSSNLLSQGSHYITLTYPGNASFNSCATGVFQATVIPAATTTTLNPPNPNLGSGSIILTAVVQATPLTVNGTTYPSNGTPPSGYVIFSTNPTTHVPLTAGFDQYGNVISSASITVSSAGTVTATYSGDPNYGNSSGSTTVTSSMATLGDNIATTTSFTIADTDNITNFVYPSQDSLTLSISVPNQTYEACVTIIVPVCFPIGIPTYPGTVSVFANGVQLNTAPITLVNDTNSNAGVATFTLPEQNGYLAVPTGKVQLTVTYSGYGVNGSFFGIDVDWLQVGASSATQPITINNDGTTGDFSLQSDTTVNQSAPLVSAGQQPTYNLRLTSLYNFNGTYASTPIKLTCSVIGYSLAGLRSTAPAGLTCGFGSLSTTTTNVTIGTSGYATQTLVVGAASVAGNTVPAQPVTRWWMAAGGGTTLACIFLLGLPARRRKWQSLLGACVLAIVGFGITGCGATVAKGPNQQYYNTINGGSSGTPNTTPTPLTWGTYTVLVTATATLPTTTLTHTLPVQVLVGTSN